MAEFIQKILNIEELTHDVRRIKVEKPKGYEFVPGQATEVAVNEPEYKDKKRPFTFTGLNNWDELEFTIKVYTDHNGVTDEIGHLKAGDELIIHDVWGAIHYDGPGVFIAGGAGVTPFISILRQLYKDGKVGDNKLFFSNKTSKDIIMQDEFEKILGNNFYNTLTREKSDKYDNRRIDKSFLEEKIKDFNQKFYVCGPAEFVKDINNALKELGADTDSLIFEK